MKNTTFDKFFRSIQYLGFTCIDKVPVKQQITIKSFKPPVLHSTINYNPNLEMDARCPNLMTLSRLNLPKTGFN